MHLVRTILTLCLTFPCTAQVVINEWVAANRSGIADRDGYAADWIELFNTNSLPQSLEGWFLSDSREKKRRWQFPAVTLAAHSFLVIYASGKDRRDPRSSLHTNFKLSSRGDSILLIAADGETVVDAVTFTKQRIDTSRGLAQDYRESTLLAIDAEGRFLVPRESKPLDWKSLDFDDSKWRHGPGGFGFDKKTSPTLNSWLRTDMTRFMRRTNSTVYYRFRFTPTTEEDYDVCVLQVRCVAGFVAYLDGLEVARRRAPVDLPYNAKADIDVEPRDPSRPDSFQIPGTALGSGPHILAVHALTDAVDTREHLIVVELKGYKCSVPVRKQHRFFAIPTPGRPNGPGFAQISQEPKLSLEAGLFRTELEVSLSCPDTAAEIRYTVDGTPPTLQSKRYREPITITKTLELRARTFRSGSMPSAVVKGRYSRLARDVWDFNSNLPLIVITTFDRKIRPKEFEAAHVHIIDTAGGRRTTLSDKPNYSGLGAIKTRGSSTLMRPKKAYGLELRHNNGTDRRASLVGMPKESDWILYGPHNFDQSHLRNALIYELARRIGLLAPRSRFVEVFVHEGSDSVSEQDYKGLYLLVERISRGKHRVNIKSLGPRDRSAPAITGGYILKIDRPGPGDMGFVSADQRLQYVYPKEREITDPQRIWLQTHFTALGEALKSSKPSDPRTGYPTFIDVPNFITYHFFSEYCKNPDAFSLSTFLYKDRGQKIHMGPAWDYDRAMRTNREDYWVGRPSLPSGWTDHSDYGWWASLKQNPEFMQAYRARARALLADELQVSRVHRLIDDLASMIREAEERDRLRWPIIPAGGWENEIINLREWVAKRSTWLRGEMLETPELISSTGGFSPPFALAMKDGNRDGRLYYTLNGADPRRVDGSVSSHAKRYEDPLEINEPTRIQVRSKVGSAWSRIRWATCVQQIPELAITEIMFNPAGGRNYEFFELTNFGTRTADLRGIEVTGTARFYFSLGNILSLAPGERCVVVRNRQFFADRYGTEGIKIAGQFLGRLSNTGGELVLTGPVREAIARALYVDSWIPEADGKGYSLTAVKPERTTTEENQWRRSESAFGTPGR